MSNSSTPCTDTVVTDGGAVSTPLRAKVGSRGLPGWTYSSSELLPMEHDRVFRPSWQIACHQADLPMAGDYVELDLYQDHIVVVRHSSGTLKAFKMLCTHRWAELSDSGPDRSDQNLEPLEIETLLGFVFVRLKCNGCSIAELWEPYLADLSPYRLPDLRPLRPLLTVEWDVNWKTVVDNSLESYHVPSAHPGLYRVIGDPVLEDSLENGISRGISVLCWKCLPRWSERLYQRYAASAASYLPPDKRDQLCFFSMLPNLSLDIFPELVRFLQVIPRGPQHSAIRIGLYGQHDETRETRLVRYLNERIDRVVMQEDRMLCNRAQFGLMSAHYEPGPLSDQEGALVEFHDLLRRAVPRMQLASAHMSAPPAA